jgi:hypothetical protein
LPRWFGIIFIGDEDEFIMAVVKKGGDKGLGELTSETEYKISKGVKNGRKY